MKLPFTTIFEYLQVSTEICTLCINFITFIKFKMFFFNIIISFNYKMIHFLIINVLYYNLQILRLIATSLKILGPNAMFYLAAAVSDFYVPWESMVTLITNRLRFMFLYYLSNYIICNKKFNFRLCIIGST